MALREEFEQQGNWLFRWRSYLPLCFMPLFLLALTQYRSPAGNRALDAPWWIGCLLISLVGLGIRCLTVGHAPKHTSGRNTQGQMAEKLNTTGIYSTVRHPLYLGNFVIWLGITLAFRSWWLTAVMVLIYWLYYERIMFAEEEFLRRKFGHDYEEWAARTPAFVPRLRSWTPPSLPFSLKTTLKREYCSFFGIIATFFVWQLAWQQVVAGRIHPDPLWLALFGIGLLTHLTLLTLKKKTRVLSVEGR
jgi:protein-S-isoprenylcysteine O-methyltransferase Ste14